MNDHMRVSDADRERVADRLREHFAEGRLSSEELDERIGAALSATTFGDLRRLTADLPEPGRAPGGTRTPPGLAPGAAGIGPGGARTGRLARARRAGSARLWRTRLGRACPVGRGRLGRAAATPPACSGAACGSCRYCSSP